MRTFVGGACALFLVACGGSTISEPTSGGAPEGRAPTRPPEPSGPPDTGAAAGLRPAGCPNEQIVPRPTSAAETATYADFLARNGAGWNASPPAWAWDAVLGRLAFSYRTDVKGAKLASVSRADAEAAARAFVAASWDLLGYRAKSTAVLATTTAMPVDATYSGGGFAWSVLVASDETQPGYEGIAGATQQLRFRVDVADDGTVRQFASTAGERRVPTLALGTSPVVDATTARGAILGLPMRHVAGPHEPPGASFDEGPITPGDVVASDLALVTDVEPSRTRLHLAHAFTVVHGPYHATLWVDACTGARLAP